MKRELYFSKISSGDGESPIVLSRDSSAHFYVCWNTSLGHEKVLTTFLNDGSVAYDRQGEIIPGKWLRGALQSDVDGFY
jgi:hypothetical protein